MLIDPEAVRVAGLGLSRGQSELTELASLASALDGESFTPRAATSMEGFRPRLVRALVSLAALAQTIGNLESQAAGRAELTEEDIVRTASSP